jgi:septum formation protein
VSAPALLLASSSPRRAQLLAPYVEFAVEPAEIDESVRSGEEARSYVARLAEEKAAAVDGNGRIVLAADTTVVLDGEIVAKPVDERDAARMLRGLSGRTHVVHTGVAVAGDVFVVSTAVRFVILTAPMIDWYVATGEPLDKAGAYAIQGVGGAFVASIDGSFSNVVGLPLAETLAALARAGVAVHGHTAR